MYQIPELKKFPELIHAFSTKEEGNMSFIWGDEKMVLKNREGFLTKLGIRLESCICLNIPNENILITVDRKLSGKGMKIYGDGVLADGLITKERNLYLFSLIADCLSLIFFDLKQNVIALIHGGWKSTNNKLAFVTAKRLITEFSCQPENLFVSIGPAIHKESYAFEKPIQKQLKKWEPFLEDLPDGKTSIDLVGYNKKQLEKAGIPSQNIFISPIDTAKDPNFFSHYRDSRKSPKNEGRFACVVGLKNK